MQAEGAQGDGAGAECTAGATADELLVPAPEEEKEGDQLCNARIQHTIGGQETQERVVQDLLQMPATARGSGNPLGGSHDNAGGVADEELGERAYLQCCALWGHGADEGNGAANPFVQAVSGFPGRVRSRRMVSTRRQR